MTTAYRINVALNLVSNSGTASRGIIRELGIVEASAVRLRGVLGTLGIGLTVAAGIREMAKATSEYADEVQKLQTVLQDSNKMQLAIATAQRVSTEVPSTNYADNVAAISDLYGVFNGNLQEITKVLGPLQQISTAMAVMGSKMDPKELFNAARAVEFTGINGDDPQFVKRLSLLGRASEFTHGKVNAAQQSQFASMANPFIAGFSDEFRYQYAPTLIQDQGSGSKAGTGLTTLLQSRLTAMTKAQLQVMEDNGFIRRGAATVPSSMGRVALKNTSDFQDVDLLLSNTYLWDKKHLFPLLDRMKSDAEREKLVALLDHQRTAARTDMIFYTRRKQFEKDALNIGNTQDPIRASNRLMQNDPKVLSTEIWKQFQNVLVNIGNDTLPVILPLMRDFRNALVELNRALSGVSSVFDPFIKKQAIIVHNGSGSEYAHKWHNAMQWIGLERSNAVPSGNKQSSTQMQGDVTLDGRKVGDVIWRDTNKRMSMPNNSGSSPDPRMSYVPNN